MSREVLRVIQDNWGYAVLLPGQGEWARSTDPRLIESYVSLVLHEEADPRDSRRLLDEILGRPPVVVDAAAVSEKSGER